MSHFLYLAACEFHNIKIAKIGITHKPRSRMGSLFYGMPIAPCEVLLREFTAPGEAAAWERVIIAEANRYRDRGEWVLDDKKLRDLWASIDGGREANMSETYAASGRPVSTRGREENRREIYRQRFRDRVGPMMASRIKYTGHPALYDRAVIQARLSEGYGVEDIAILDEISTANVRREIARLRKVGKLAALYSTARSA